MIRRKIFAANWKLNKGPADTKKFFDAYLPKLNELNLPPESEIIFFPTAVSLDSASQCVKSTRVKIGAQNVYAKTSGAFTGENSADLVRELGIDQCLVGHSERRQLFFETDELCAEKVTLIQSLNLTPMLCIGETLEQRDKGETKSVCQKQLKIGLSKANPTKPVIVAYEPVWAIGTGRVATPEQVAQAHTDIFEILKEMGFQNTPILYGGSVKPDNCKGLINLSHVSGFLVGGASLEPVDFLKICQS